MPTPANQVTTTGKPFFADNSASQKPAKTGPLGLSAPVSMKKSMEDQGKVGAKALNDLSHLTKGTKPSAPASKKAPPSYQPGKHGTKVEKANVKIKEAGGPGVSLDQAKWASGTKTVKSENGSLMGFKVNDKLFNKLPEGTKKMLLDDFKKQLGVPKNQNLKSESKDGVTFYGKKIN